MAIIIALLFWISAGNLVLAAPPAETHTPPEPEIQNQRWVTFSYKDSNFERVFIAGTFTNWVNVPLDESDGHWSISLEIPEGKQYYRYMVDEGHDSWIAVDPENQNIRNHEEFGWVSVLDEGHQLNEASREKNRLARRKLKIYRQRVKNELEHGLLPRGEVTYQRVDGLVVSAGKTYVEPEGGMAPSARINGHFGFSSGRLGGSLTVLQPIIPNHLLDLKLNILSQTQANNYRTGIGSDENSLAGFFLHEDYMDYHHSKGLKLSLVLKLGTWFRWQGGFRTEEQTSLWAPSVWSVKDGDFIPNPAIDEGSLNSLFSRIAIGKKYNYFAAMYQRSSDHLVGGDFEFEKINAKIRGRLKLGKGAGFDIRLDVGFNLSGQLPAQERYLLGGLGTVRGYSYQSLMIPQNPEATDTYGGQQMALGNLEYFFRLGKFLRLNLFYDAGMVWEDKDANPSINQLKTSTGLGLNLGKGDNFRINMIQRLDDRTRPVVFQFRMKRMF